MIPIIKAIVIAAFVAAAPVQAKEPQSKQTNSKEWVVVTPKVHLRAGSYEIRPMKGGGDVFATAIVRTVDRGSLTLARIGINGSACGDGYGELHGWDLGDRLLWTQNYVSKGGNVASDMGDLLCSMLAKDLAAYRAGKAGSASSSVGDSIPAAIEAEARREVDAFAADPRHGRFEEVRELMADLIDAATARGEAMSLEQAYAQACQLRDRVIPFQKKTTAPAPIGF